MRFNSSSPYFLNFFFLAFFLSLSCWYVDKGLGDFREGKTSLPQIPANFLRYSSFFYPEVPNEEARSTE